MKKLLALLMALIFVFTFAACGSEDKDDDKKDDDKKVTSASDEVTPAPSTPASPEDAAEKAVADLLDNLNTKKLIELSGEDTSTLGEGEDFALAIFDASILNSEYRIVSAEKVDDTTVNVGITLTTPKVDTYFEEMFADKVESVEEPENEEDAIQLIVEIIEDTFSDPSINTNTIPLTLTAKLVNGTWTVEVTEELFTALTEGPLYIFSIFANM